MRYLKEKKAISYFRSKKFQTNHRKKLIPLCDSVLTLTSGVGTFLDP